jgi:hypothetical protein
LVPIHKRAELYCCKRNELDCSEGTKDQAERMPGINLAWDNMYHAQWLQKVTMHCDSWLTRVSFFIGAGLLNATIRYIVLLRIILSSTCKTQSSDYIMQYTDGVANLNVADVTVALSAYSLTKMACNSTAIL